MLRIFACLLTVSLGVVGCATEPASTDQDETAPSSHPEAWMSSELSATPAALPAFCSHPKNCLQFCDCDFIDCRQIGGVTLQQCRDDQDFCFSQC